MNNDYGGTAATVNKRRHWLAVVSGWGRGALNTD